MDVTHSTAWLLKIWHKSLWNMPNSLSRKKPQPHLSLCSGLSSPRLLASLPASLGSSNRKNQGQQTKPSKIHNFNIQTQLFPSGKATSAACGKGSSAMEPGWGHGAGTGTRSRDRDTEQGQGHGAGLRDAIKVIRETKEEQGKEAASSKHRWLHC